MQINTCTHREETLYEMVLVHGQAKESNPALIGCCYMQCHAQSKTHLARRRRGSDDDQICTLQSFYEGIEILESRGNASHLSPLCMESLARV